MKTKKRLILLLLLLLTAPVFCGGTSAESTERLPDETLMAYYSHSIFAGDSVICLFRNYVKEVRKSDAGYFSGVKFYCAYSYQLKTASMEYIRSNTDQVYLTYKGSNATLAEIMKGEKPDRVFIHAGLNENIHRHLDWAESYVNKIMALRDKYAPGAQVCFLSLTPVTAKIGNPRQELHDRYNAWLEQKCVEAGAVFIDIATPLKGDDGFLPKAISRDNEFHLNAEGNAVFAQTLLDFAQAQYEAGLWDPAEVRP